MAVDKRGKQLPRGVSWREDKQTYMGRFMFQGQQVTLYDKDLKSLKKRLDEKRFEMERGLAGRADKISLNKWFEMWLTEYKIGKVKPTSVDSYEKWYNCHVRPTLGSKYLTQIRPIHVQQLYNTLLQTLSVKTVQNVRIVVHDMLETAMLNGLIVKNPAHGLRLPTNEQEEPRVLTVSEQRTLLTYIKLDEFKQYAPLVIVMLGAGLRIGECLALRWSDIDFDNNEIRVVQTLVYSKNRETGRYEFSTQSPKTKTSARTIPMLAEVAKALRQQRVEQMRLRLCAGAGWQPLAGFEDLVFTTVHKGTPLQKAVIREYLMKIVQRVNEDEAALAEKEHRAPVLMENLHPHTLRHSFATRAIEQGMEPKVLQKLMGHSSIKVTLDRYVHVTEDKKKDDMKLMEALFNAANY